MRLHYAKGACSLAPHIALKELEIPHELCPVDFRKGENRTPEFLRLNALGAVPVLELDDEPPLTEVTAILQYLARMKPEHNLAPEPIHRLQEWLSFISTELHKSFFPVFFPDRYVQEGKEELRKGAREILEAKLKVADLRMQNREHTLQTYSVADIYLYVVCTWTGYVKLDLPANLKRFTERIQQRPAVQRAMEAEGLVKA